MFTGIVEEVGTVEALRQTRLRVRAKRVLRGLRPGDSVAVDGVCLTVVKADGGGFEVDLGPATLRRTTLGLRRPQDLVNLERPLTLAQRLGGHLVQGHVDGVSLTVAGLSSRSFRVCLIPQTLRRTTLALKAPGDPVNLEADVLAKYVARLLEGWRKA